MPLPRVMEAVTQGVAPAGGQVSGGCWAATEPREMVLPAESLQAPSLARPATEPHTKRSLPSGAHPDISRPLTARPPGALLKFITMSQAPHHLPPAPRPPQRGDDL